MEDIYSSNPIRMKINKIFDSHFVTDNNSEVLNTLSGICSSQSYNTKRVLINEIERKDIMVNKAILMEFLKVKEKLNSIVDGVKTLDNAVKGMANRLHESKIKTHHLISQTTQLKVESQKTEKKMLWAYTFVNNFQLSPEETEYLFNVSVKTPLTPDFLITLSTIESLYDKSKVLVKSGYQTPAFDIMEVIGMQQEIAMEKLYHWTIGACRSTDAPKNLLIPKALGKFQNRQVLFANIVEEYATARKTTIIQNLIDALTKGSTSSKPIEFYANDTKKYISDILSWVCQVIPSEKENLNVLFQYCDLSNIKDQMTIVLTNIMEAICPLLKVRAEIILNPDKDPLVLWSITNLFNYHKDIIFNSIQEGQLTETLQELVNKSENVFIITLDSKIQKELSHGVKAPPSDLSPSSVVADLVSFLRDILSTMNISNNINTVDKKIIFTHLLDPLLKAINETACHLSSTDMSVYMLNCIYHIQCTLSLYTVMDDYNERLQAQSEAQIDTLTSEQASYLVANLNLGPIYTILQEKVNGPMSAIPGMDTSTLKSFLNKFDKFLVNPEMFLLPQINLLLSHTHKSLVKKRAFEVILAIYEQLYKAVYNPVNCYEEPNTIVKRTPDEVKKLLV